MESRNHSDTELVEKHQQQALQELKLSQEESHLLLALERSSEEQDALDEELKKDWFLQEKEKELSGAVCCQKHSICGCKRQAQEQSNQSQQAQNENDEADTSANDISSDSQLHQRLQEHHKKSNERWTKMEEHIAKASDVLLSLQQRFAIKQPLDGV